jgi:two-component system KDP operon response regulator KdpE
MKPKILLVDDLEEILEALKKLLRSCELTEARDGKSAVELAASGRPDLVLLDYHLPDMGGDEVLEKMRKLDPPPVVIIMTGDDTVETAGKSLAAGAFAHITKPFEAKQMLELVIKGLEFAEKEKAKRGL